MNYRFDGPMCFVEGIGERKQNVSILVPRLVKDNGDFRMNLSEPEDEIQWVSVYINKRDRVTNEQVIKPIHIECDSYDQVITFVDALQARHGELIKQARIEKKKPWLRAHRQMIENEKKPVTVEKTNEVSDNHA